MSEFGTITAVEPQDYGGYAITYNNGWTLFVSSKELNGLVPKVHDTIVVGPSIGYPIQYISIDGHVIRDISDEEQAKIRQDMLDGFHRRKLEEFVKHGDEWKETARGLHPLLSRRIKRFEDEQGDTFWIEDGGYELYALQAADALARHAMSVYPGDSEKQVEWIDWWNSINSKEHNYDYKRQMEILPEFGDGHSGNTHGAGVAYAKRVVLGKDC